MSRQVLIGLLVLAGVSLLGVGAAEHLKSSITPRDSMTIQALQDILAVTVQELKEGDSQWRFSYADVEMALLTSEPHDRMRIVAPIGPEAELTDRRRKQMLDARAFLI
ncbi:hypothetical protein [Nitrospira defluvii]|uniref:Uncharacterized protein n=1 Tax=Nitrospira defluvii TaxID=330214 RepID=A0ABN7MEE3_9BACT|nr:hypothetical protein [Nitrospira defluvii]CAE6797705.1 hypothetical protein NSPZN2_70176 [Nitrospira defluvii]